MMKMSVGDGNPLVPQVGPGNQNTSRHHLRLFTNIYRNIQMGPSITLQLLMSNKPHGLINEDPKPQIRRQGTWRFLLEIPTLEDNSEMQ
jgi:hypothetical protein